MRRLSLSALLLLFMVSLLPITAEAKRERHTAASKAVNRSNAEQAVLRDFELILDLWRDGRYDDLFERTAAGKNSKEQLAEKLASATRRPACCWEKMQDAQVSLKSERAAVVRARLGFEGNVSGTVFVTKGINLKKEGDLWLISQSELFSLANISRKKVLYKYLPIQGK